MAASLNEMNQEGLKIPSLYYFFTELPRAFWSYIRGYQYYRSAPKVSTKKSTPVLVIPGLLTSDISTSLLRKFLSKKGYDCYGWNQGFNLANMRDLKKVKIQIDELQKKYDSKIILIGWSLGGIYARHLSKHHADQIQQVITLGSPYMGVNAPNRAHLSVKILKKGKNFTDNEKEIIAALPDPLTIPNMAVYSKKDGIVPWKACYEQGNSDLHSAYEVEPGHFGMGVSRELFKIFDEVLI